MSKDTAVVPVQQAVCPRIAIAAVVRIDVIGGNIDPAMAVVMDAVPDHGEIATIDIDPIAGAMRDQAVLDQARCRIAEKADIVTQSGRAVAAHAHIDAVEDGIAFDCHAYC